MTDKTQPIKFPIDPKKMYVTKWSGFEMYISGRDFLDKIFDYDFKLTAEIVPETQPRDWSDVVEDILLQAWKFKNATYPKTLSQSSCFKEEVLAILQEFDAQNQAKVSDNKVNGKCVSDKPTEEPLECTKRYSVPLTIGEIYDVAGNGCFVDQAKLLSIAAESDHFIVQGMVLPVTYKVHRDRILSKHTPKPVEHIYSDIEIINELETWQEEPISPKHFCIRGQIIRQQMKELGKGYCKL